MDENILGDIANASTDEFYTPIPDGYKPGKTKYVFVTGSVISGIGKGIFTSCLAKLLKDRGLKIAPMKIEAYMNVDAGTLNPYRHGEVFVLDDGTETDMDLGSYERFLEQNLDKNSFVTSGRIYSSIIEKERKGLYLGRDVQFIPHVTGETKKIFRDLAVGSKADVVIIEVGGTVGDYENLFALESARELMYEEGVGNACFVNLTYILEPHSLGEHKSKAAQLGIKRLLELGIQPDIVVCRSETPIPEKIKEKISMNVNVPVKQVIGLHDTDDIYTLPLFLRELGVDEQVLNVLGLAKKFPVNGNKKLKAWTEEVSTKPTSKEITVGIAGKYTGLRDSYISIIKSLEHCQNPVGAKINFRWIETTDVEKGKITALKALDGIDGLIVPGGFGSRGTEGKISCIKHARENNIPFLGLCFGFQMAVIEYARNMCNLENANTTEIDPKTNYPVICILPEQEEVDGLGGTMRLGGYDVFIKKNSIAHKLYGSEKVRERFRHRFNVNTNYIDQLEEKGLVFSGNAGKKRIMQILELPGHKFFFGTQFHPEFTSRPTKPNPAYLGFVKACAE